MLYVMCYVLNTNNIIRIKIIEKLEESSYFPLVKNIAPNQSGVYILYHKNELVYIGKSTKNSRKSIRTMRQRINEHYDKLMKVSLYDMKLQYLTFTNDWLIPAVENFLISHYNPIWNESGFGCKVPGQGRPGTHRINDWNKKYSDNTKKLSILELFV